MSSIVRAVGVAAAASPRIGSLRLWLYYRITKLLGGEQYLWPPSRQSFPALGGFWGLIALAIWYCVQEKKSKAIAQVETVRREYALGSLDNLLANETARVKEFAEKEHALLDLDLPVSRAKIMSRKEIREIAEERKAAKKLEKAARKARAAEKAQAEGAAKAS